MNHRQAQTIIEAAVAKSDEMGVAMTIAVVDKNADLVAQVRMEGATRFTVELARGKAMVSAIFQQPSGAVIGGNVLTDKFNHLAQGQLAFIQGAVPVFADGALIGAVGVSGAAPGMDEDVATTAATAVGG